MISKELAAKIWECHREIEAGNKLLADIEKTIAKNKEQNYFPRTLAETGKSQYSLQLGIPSGERSLSLFSVSIELAVPVIHAHLANQQAHLVELNQIAGMAAVESQPQ